jgi:hypothetical protein
VSALGEDLRSQALRELKGLGEDLACVGGVRTRTATNAVG